MVDRDTRPISDNLRLFIEEAPQVRQPHVAFLRQVADDLAPGSVVLDVGSGSAPYRELFEGLTYLTVDWAGTEHTPDTPVDIVSVAHDIPRANGSVDGIVCTQVLEHVPEPGLVLDEFFRLLRPGGLVYLTVPLTWYLHEMPYDFYRYTPWGLRYLFEKSGFVDIDIAPMNDSPGTVAELLRHLRWILGTADDGLDERRASVGDMLARFADAVESVGYLDTQLLLPISLSVRATRPQLSADARPAAAPQTEASHAPLSRERPQPGASTDVTVLVASTQDTTPDVSVVVTGHHEGRLAHHTLRSLARSAEAAVEQGITVEIVCVLDRPDDATRDFFTHAVSEDGYFAGLATRVLVEVSHGDPGLARNDAVRTARGHFVALVDADNLVSRNWLCSAVRQLRMTGTDPVVVHPEFLVTFDAQHVIWPQIPSDDEDFRTGALYSFNYWDTICVTTRDVLLRHPYQSSGECFGPEDWHWNTVTLFAGVRHTVAPETTLFYRVKRTGSRNQQIMPEGRPLLPTPLLTSREVARASAHFAPADEAYPPAVTTPAMDAVFADLRQQRETGAPAPAPFMTPAPAASTLGARRRGRKTSGVVPSHYRALYSDLAHLSDEQLLEHYAQHGRSEGRIPALTAEQQAQLTPDRFVASHYRLLNPDLAELTDGELARHFLEIGRAENRVAVLDANSLEALTAFDVADYRSLNRDIDAMTDDELVAHFVRHGRAENRRVRLTARERAHAHLDLPPWLLSEWTAVHALEPAIPVPTPEVLRHFEWYMPPPGGDASYSVWWQLVEAMPDRTDFLFFAPWMRMGGGDAVLARYAEHVSREKPDRQITVITTEGGSTRVEWLPENVRHIELCDLEGYSTLTRAEQRKLVANIVIQFAPSTVHIMNSPIAFDAVESYAQAMSLHTDLFLSTFVIEHGPRGELYNWMLRRPPGFLDFVRGVMVDNHVLVDQLWDLYRFPREKFHVHHSPVELPELPPRRERSGRSDGLDVLWAARFDRQKRPDILAAIVAETRRRDLPVRFHVYGDAVIASADEFRDDLDRMASLGVTFHKTYKSFASLPPERFDAFLMTSQWEGIPLTLLDAMAYGLPVIAPPVGGMAEVLDDTTGFTIARFDDIGEYVDAITQVLDNPKWAAERADRARARLVRDFSWDAWRAAVADTPGYLGEE